MGGGELSEIRNFPNGQFRARFGDDGRFYDAAARCLRSDENVFNVVDRINDAIGISAGDGRACLGGAWICFLAT